MIGRQAGSPAHLSELADGGRGRAEKDLAHEAEKVPPTPGVNRPSTARKQCGSLCGSAQRLSPLVWP